MNHASIEYLEVRPEFIPDLTQWFESEWPEYYGLSGRGSAAADLQSYANRSALPIGLVALIDEVPCGFIALKAEPFQTHPHLFPWVGAAYVRPHLRRQGIGQTLITAAEVEAKKLGHGTLYCATGTAATLLERCGWKLRERVLHQDQDIAIYEKAL